MWDRAEALWDRGLNMMIYDDPGYGLSTGEPAEAELFENAAAVLELLPTRHAEMLEAAATGEVTVRIVPGADHSECALVGGEAYWQWIVDFAAGAP